MISGKSCSTKRLPTYRSLSTRARRPAARSSGCGAVREPQAYLGSCHRWPKPGTITDDQLQRSLGCGPLGCDAYLDILLASWAIAPYRKSSSLIAKDTLFVEPTFPPRRPVRPLPTCAPGREYPARRSTPDEHAEQHFHNLDHVAEMWLRHRKMARGTLRTPRVRRLVASAIVFHDAVYDPRRSDNEAASAALWRRLASRSRRLPRELIRQVATAIEATACHPTQPSALPASPGCGGSLISISLRLPHLATASRRMPRVFALNNPICLPRLGKPIKTVLFRLAAARPYFSLSIADCCV